MRLTVKQLKNRDPGSGLAVIDREALSDLGVTSGDFVTIEGRDGSRSIARVWPSDSSDAGRGTIRIDGQLRRAANVSIDDQVTVEPTEVEPAERVTLALPGNVRVRGDLSSHLHERLLDQAVTAGQTVAFSLGFGALSGRSSRRVPLRVVDTNRTAPSSSRTPPTSNWPNGAQRKSPRNPRRWTERPQRRSHTRISVVSTTNSNGSGR
jgi:transitional endoplasmic reticulum ATPase